MLLRMISLLFGIAGLLLAIAALYGYFQGNANSEFVLFFCLGGIMFSLAYLGESLATRWPLPTERDDDES